ncbi:hypothetical protein BLA29_010487 [Euroglyphus maynei]|uniref:Uncharacterized protein n=1 Tax=Euroglyphus maynei TaxID=6958 RepID=A0A1Y3BKW9_EURMA|nr:hypothetical protein BLA29_010487 [Euroglyphus maynei]
MESEIETNSYEPNRIIKEFEKRAKENEMNGKNLIPSKTTRLIEKFEKKSQGIDSDGRRGQTSNGQSMVNNMKKVFEPNNGQTNTDDDDTPDRVIPSGSTNKLIGMFQPTTIGSTSEQSSSSSSLT